MSADSAAMEIEVDKFFDFSFSVLFVDVFDAANGNWDDATASDEVLLLETGGWLDTWFFNSVLSEYAGFNAKINITINK